MSSHPREQLSAWLDGELSAAEQATLRAHLAACPQCAEELEELGLLGQAARELDEPAPEGYFDELPGRVRQRLREARQAAGPRRPRLPAWSWAVAATLLVGLLLPIVWKRQAEAPLPAAVTAPTQGTAPQRHRDTEAREVQPGETRATSPALPASQMQGPYEAEAKSTGKRQGALQEGAATAAAPVPAPTSAPPRQPEPTRAEDRAAPGFAAAPPAAAPAPASLEADRDQLGHLGYADESVAQSAPAAGAGPPAASAAESAKSQAEKPAEAEERLRKDEAQPERRAAQEPTADSRRKVALGRSGGEGQAAPGKQKGELGEFAKLKARQPKSAGEARALAREWQREAETQASPALADEARLRALEALAEAFRLSASRADRAALERAVEAYAARADAAQKARARALIER